MSQDSDSPASHDDVEVVDEEAPQDEGSSKGGSSGDQDKPVTVQLVKLPMAFRAGKRNARASDDEESLSNSSAESDDDDDDDDDDELPSSSSSSASTNSSDDDIDWFDGQNADYLAMKCSFQVDQQQRENVAAYVSLPRSRITQLSGLRQQLLRMLRRQLIQRGFRGIKSVRLPWSNDVEWLEALSSDSKVIQCVLTVPETEAPEAVVLAENVARQLRAISYQSRAAMDPTQVASKLAALLEYLRGQQQQEQLDPNSLVDGYEGFSLMTLACASSYPPVIESLLALGGDPLLSDGSGQNGLQTAAKAGRSDVLGVLFEQQHFEVGQEELSAQVERGVYRNWLPLHLAICSGDTTCVSMLLDRATERHFEPIARIGRNVFHLCALYSNIKVAASLLERISDDLRGRLLAAQDSRGATPLILAALQRKADLATLYIRVSPSIADTVDAQDLAGDTALHHAFSVQGQRISNYCEPISAEHFPTAYVLIVLGNANINIANREGDLPFDLLPLPSANLLEAIASDRQAFLDITWSSLFQPNNPFFETNLAISKNFRGLIADHLQDIDRVSRELASQGGCPVFSADKVPSRRRKPVPEHNLFLNQLREELDQLPPSSAATSSSSSSSSSSGNAAQCPFGFTNDSASKASSSAPEAKCPFGFTGPNPHVSPHSSSSSSSSPSASTPQSKGVSSDLVIGLIGGAIVALVGVAVVALVANKRREQQI